VESHSTHSSSVPRCDARPSGLWVDASRDVNEWQAEQLRFRFVFVVPSVVWKAGRWNGGRTLSPIQPFTAISAFYGIVLDLFSTIRTKFHQASFLSASMRSKRLLSLAIQNSLTVAQQALAFLMK